MSKLQKSKSSKTVRREAAEKPFNGKPMSHWRREADLYVMEVLVRGMTTGPHKSIIHKLANDRLMACALTLVPEGGGLADSCALLSKVLNTRESFRADTAELRKYLDKLGLLVPKKHRA